MICSDRIASCNFSLNVVNDSPRPQKRTNLSARSGRSPFAQAGFFKAEDCLIYSGNQARREAESANAMQFHCQTVTNYIANATRQEISHKTLNQSKITNHQYPVPLGVVHLHSANHVRWLDLSWDLRGAVLRALSNSDAISFTLKPIILGTVICNVLTRGERTPAEAWGRIVLENHASLVG